MYYFDVAITVTIDGWKIVATGVDWTVESVYCKSLALAWLSFAYAFVTTFNQREVEKGSAI